MLVNVTILNYREDECNFKKVRKIFVQFEISKEINAM
jgi:hypothetical protein